MKTLLILISATICFAGTAHSFEAENEPISQKQFVAKQKKQGAEEKKNAAKFPAVPSAGTLMQTGKNGAVYRMMFTGHRMIGFKCDGNPTVCEFRYLGADSGFGKKEGSGMYSVECHKSAPCMALVDANGSDSTVVYGIVRFDGIVEFTNNLGQVIRAPQLIVDSLE
jgi:hypothetical protein